MGEALPIAWRAVGDGPAGGGGAVCAVSRAVRRACPARRVLPRSTVRVAAGTYRNYSRAGPVSCREQSAHADHADEPGAVSRARLRYQSNDCRPFVTLGSAVNAA